MTKQLEHAAQDEVVRIYRDRLGYPRLQQADERDLHSIAVAALCVAGVVAGVVLAWCVS